MSALVEEWSTTIMKKVHHNIWHSQGVKAKIYTFEKLNQKYEHPIDVILRDCVNSCKDSQLFVVAQWRIAKDKNYYSRAKW